MRDPAELLASLLRASLLLRRNDLSIEELVVAYRNFYDAEALDGHEDDDHDLDLLVRHHEICELHRHVQTEVIDQAGRIEPAEAARRLGALADDYRLGAWLAEHDTAPRVDLTAKLRDALARGWKPGELAEAIAFARLEWEHGEQWASIPGDQRVGLVWARGPLALVDQAHHERLRPFLERCGLVVETVADWDAEIYCIDRAAIDELFDTPGWDNDMVDARRMSISDLWHQTVS